VDLHRRGQCHYRAVDCSIICRHSTEAADLNFEKSKCHWRLLDPLIVSQIAPSMKDRNFTNTIFMEANHRNCRVVGAILAEIVVSENLFPTLDPTYDLWLPTLLNQTTGCLSVVTACLPYLKPFMESIEPDIVLVEGDSPSEDNYFTGTSRSGGFMLSPLSNLSTGCGTSSRDDRSTGVRP
jgi:hypothetical protein